MKLGVDKLLLGYKIIRFDAKDRGRVLTALLKNGLYASVGAASEFAAPAWRARDYEKALRGVTVSIGELCGLPGAIFKLRRRYGVIAGAVFLILYFAFISLFVWDVRVSGNEELGAETIISELSDAGLSVGTPWLSLSPNEVENTLLATSQNIAWVNVNRRGAVAYVVVREKHVPPQGEENLGYSNVVAREDSVITDITVFSGYAKVKVGDTVKAGDILISGIIPAELGGGFVRAAGEVSGRAIRTVSTTLPRSTTVNVGLEPQWERSDLYIFNFSINIFKKYRKSYEECAIIEKDTEICLPGGSKLPVKIRNTYVSKITTEEVVYTDSELVSLANGKLVAIRQNLLSECEILRIRTYGEFIEGGYCITSRAVVITPIGEEVFFYKEG